LRATRPHSEFIAAAQRFATSALTSAISLRGERLQINCGAIIQFARDALQTTHPGVMQIDMID
jgi:hypothetical protein